MQPRMRHARVRTAVAAAALAVMTAACVPAPYTAPAPPAAAPAPRAGQADGYVHRHPAPWEFPQRKLTAVPPVPAGEADSSGPSLRHADLTDLNLRDSSEFLFGHADFDSATRWPALLPPGFDPERILELGKDPGLGIRELHRQGITGQGVYVAILDQTLLVDHTEYADRVVYYDEVGAVDIDSSMHGPAVAALLAGRTVGVAPGVKVVYYAVQWARNGTGPQRTFLHGARTVHRILDDNAALPPSRRVRVISMSIGWMPGEEGYAEMEAAVARARREGVFVVSSDTGRHYGVQIAGLDRDPLADPDDFRSYGPGRFWRQHFYREPGRWGNLLLAPMDARTTADMSGQADYVFFREGGLSWSVPYLAGVYALALQVKPDLSPRAFLEVAVATGHDHQVTHAGRTYQLGPIINPPGIIARLQSL